ncbi:hypothetical protein DFH05DRAFT_88806 [Lentinula detonsa]|uniref:Uncharacterized protein n=1 Tax=Lentinula detonsa TaxID=2804962 RepID=A0A9W8PAW4_9AGAR|nr:hypothetical protein DFH05DRAFT_88806 [Lentinula detonsa]
MLAASTKDYKGIKDGTNEGEQGTAIFGGRREGLALYFSRLVRPLWKAKMIILGVRSL